MLLLFRISLNEHSPTEMMVEALTAANYLRAVADPYYRQGLLTTLAVATGSTFLALAIGFPAAYWLAPSARSSGRSRRRGSVTAGPRARRRGGGGRGGVRHPAAFRRGAPSRETCG